ncbi:MAG: hypothetical protein GX776_07255 [Oxalobacter sp.]|nr:hypothetical protein [Oxalobacter sp.]
MFSHIPFTADFAWAGVFGNTKDRLGYIGKVPGMRNYHAILGGGENSIVFKMIGTRIILNELMGQKNPVHPLLYLNGRQLKNTRKSVDI